MSTEHVWFWWPVRVYYEDTDAGGIVYNANYLRYFERARTEWLRTLGIEHGSLAAEHGRQLVLRRADVEFRAPARLDDALEVGVAVTRVRRASLEVEQRVCRGAEAHLCSAHVQIACVDVQRLRPCAFPPSLLGCLE